MMDTQKQNIKILQKKTWLKISKAFKSWSWNLKKKTNSTSIDLRIRKQKILVR